MTQYSNEEINDLVVETIYELADFENPPELVFAQLLPLVHDEHALAAGAEWAWRHVPRQGIERLNNLTDGPPTELREGTTWSHEWTVSYAGKTQLIRAHAQVCGGSLHPAVEAYGLDETDDGNDWELLSCGVPLDHLLHAGRTRNHDHECD
jgi:hypothetical protein